MTVRGESSGRGSSPALVLAASMAVNATIQVLWISYAAVAGDAARYYGVSEGAVGWFAMSFMVAFLPLSLPASWLIDTRGVPRAVGLGALVAGVAGVARGLAGPSFALALGATCAIAAVQPLLLNAWTATAAQWFAPGRRATAVSLITFANLAGTGIGLAVTPALAGTYGIGCVQLVYGVAALLAGLFFAAVVRRPVQADTERALVLDGLRDALRVRPFWAYLAAIFLGMGVFNGVTTWIEPIVRPRGMTAADAGLVGLVMLLAGVVGAVTLSALSDRVGRRTPFLALGLLGGALGLLGVAIAPSPWLVLVSAGVLGFFLTSAFPIGMQYSAEVTAPTPEGTTAGLLQLVAQGSVVLVYAMAAVGSFPVALTVAAGLLLGAAALMAVQRERRVG